jgi:hypothetical protein
MTAWPLTRHVKRPACLLAPLLLFSWTSAAVAADATVTAQTCESLPKGAPVTLSPADDSPLYLSIKAHMKQAVERSGHPVQDATPLQLYYSAEESAVEVRRQGPSLGQIDVHTRNQRARAQLLVNVWSTSKDSIFGGQKNRRKFSVSNFLIMSLELNRQDNGRCVWRGEGAVELEGVTARQVAKGLTDAIAAHIGETVEHARVPLR